MVTNNNKKIKVMNYEEFSIGDPNKSELETELLDHHNEFKAAQYDLFENNTANNKLKVLVARKKGIFIAGRLEEYFQTKYSNISFNLN